MGLNMVTLVYISGFIATSYGKFEIFRAGTIHLELGREFGLEPGL